MSYSKTHETKIIIITHYIKFYLTTSVDQIREDLDKIPNHAKLIDIDEEENLIILEFLEVNEVNDEKDS